MRLTSKQQQEIIQTFLEVFEKGEIRLFGSRVNNANKGGDIDLYVKPFLNENIAEKRITFLAKLKRKIGEQKIDLVIAQEPATSIDHVAQQQGVMLCQNG